MRYLTRHIPLVLTTVIFWICYMSQSAICQNSGALPDPIASSTKDALQLPGSVLGLIAVKDTKKLLKYTICLVICY